jgi:hypothetical protein
LGVFRYCNTCALIVCTTCGGQDATVTCIGCQGSVHDPSKKNWLQQACSVLIKSEVYCSECSVSLKESQETKQSASNRRSTNRTKPRRVDANVQILRLANNACVSCKAAVAVFECTESLKYCESCMKQVCGTCHLDQAGDHTCRDCRVPIHNSNPQCCVGVSSRKKEFRFASNVF